MKVAYSADGNTAYFDGYKFRKDKKTGYYLATKPTYNGRRERLHCYVWRYFNGLLPMGYHVHHMDENKGHNDIENLACIFGCTHSKYHSLKYASGHMEAIAENLARRARPKASEWHKSEEGRQWHRKRGLPASVYEKVEKVCEFCGKKYWTVDHGMSRFCSNWCKSAARRKSGVDDETRTCQVCGEPFTANRYSSKRFCSVQCRTEFHRSQIHKAAGETAGL